LLEVQELRDWAAIIPVSAVGNEQVDLLADELIELLPEGHALYPMDTNTDEDIEKRISELIRETILEGVHEELPHSLAVTLDDMIQREDKDLLEIYANVFVERDSQKGIIIGNGGERLKDIGQRSRAAIEPLVGQKVFLSIRVKVAKDWQRDPKLLQRLGF
jgi:GTP-binding protein Era